jgi:hypothetical protein
MKTLLSLLFLLFTIQISIAQTTAIPDANFEQALIDLGYDNGVPDGGVLTTNIDTISYLHVDQLMIVDLTGIEDFTALIELNCSLNPITTLDVSQNIALTWLTCKLNQLSSLDVSQNTALTYLDCDWNQLTSLDVSLNTALTYLDCHLNQLTSLNVSQNTALTYLGCHLNQLPSLNVSQNTALTTLSCGGNQFTSLDVSQNTSMEGLYCQANQITSLDLSQNTMLEMLFCPDNQLTCLNVKSGNNANLTSINTANNPNLTCIEVDNTSWSTSNWIDIDLQTSFSTNCTNPCLVGVVVNYLSKVSTYPNPTTAGITIDLSEIKQDVKVTLTNSLGQVILCQNYNSTSFIKINIGASKGIYFLQLESDQEVITKKIIKE